MDYVCDSAHALVRGGLYRFATLGINLLYLTYLYKNAWQAYRFDPGLAFSDWMKNLPEMSGGITDLFCLSNVKEGTFSQEIAKFYRYSQTQVEGLFNAPIKHRNSCAHANGEIYIENADMCLTRFVEVRGNIRSIQKKHENDVLRKVFGKRVFLAKTWNDTIGLLASAEADTDAFCSDFTPSNADLGYLLGLASDNQALEEAYPKKAKPNDGRPAMLFYKKISVASLFFRYCELTAGTQDEKEDFITRSLGEFQGIFAEGYDDLGVDILKIYDYFRGKMEDRIGWEGERFLGLLKTIEGKCKADGEREVIAEKIAEITASKK